MNIDLEIVMECARLMIMNRNHVLANLIAAQALKNNMFLVTRNIKDYKDSNLKLLNLFN